MTTKKTYFTILFISIVLFSSCKITQKSYNNRIEQQQQKALSPTQMVKNIQNQQPAFRRAYAKDMSVGINIRGREMDVKATCKIVTDSAIHISIQPFMRIELFKIEMTPQKLLIIDKTNKTFYESNYGILYETTGLKINYDEIQSIISNRLFVPDKKVIRPSDFKWENDTTQKTIIRSENGTQQLVTIDQTIGRITEILLKEQKRNLTLKITYTDFNLFNKTAFPTNIAIEAESKKSTAKLKFNIKKVEFEQPFLIKPAKLIRYRTGSIKTLLDK